MKTDRELLELAARAAGIFDEHEEVSDCTSGGFWLCDSGRGYPWNPLTDDGDALRMAVKLGILFERNLRWSYVAAFYPDIIGRFEESFDNDAYAATRRAIVRAAAAIGEGMK